MKNDLRIKLKIDADTGELIVTQKEFNKLGKAVDNTKGSFDSFISKAKTIVGVGAAYIAFEQTIGKLITTGIQFNKEVETMGIGIASLISVNSDNETSLGRVISANEKYKMATIASKEAIESLKEANKQTSATLPQLTEAFQSALAPAMKAGLSIKETVEYTKLMTQAAGAMGVPMNQLSQEIKSVVSGTIDMNSVVATNLGLTNDQIKKAKEQGDLYNFLVSKLNDFAIAGNDVSNSFEGSMSNMQDAFMELAGELTNPIFDSLKENSKELTGWFQKMTDKLREFKLEITNINELKNIEEMNQKMLSLAKEWNDYESKKNKPWYSWDWLPQDAILKQQRDVEGEISLLAEKMNNISFPKKEVLIPLTQEEFVTETKVKNNNFTQTKSKKEAKEKIDTTQYDTHIKAYEEYVEKKKRFNEYFEDDYNKSIKTQSQYQIYELNKQKDEYSQYVDDKNKLDVWYAAEFEQIQKNRADIEKNGLDGIKEAFDEYIEHSGNSFRQMNNLFKNALHGMEDFLVDFIKTGKASFSDFINSIAEDFIRMMIQINITKPLATAASSMDWGSMFSGFAFANGGVMTNQGALPLKAYANGGIANTPQLALFGEGRMPEAYVPLPDGRTIPVTIKGGNGGTNIVLNIENKTGQSIDASQISQMTKTDSEGKKTEVISIVMDAYNRNVMQFRDLLNGGR